jgi:hypothetical protein
MLRAALLLSLFSAAFARDCTYAEGVLIEACHGLYSYQCNSVGTCMSSTSCWTSVSCEYSGSTCTYNYIDYNYGSCPSVSAAVDNAFKFAGAVLIGTIGAGLRAPNAQLKLRVHLCVSWWIPDPLFPES